MPWYLYLALKQLFPTGRKLTFFTAISVLGVALGVWVMIVFPGVMGGFGEKYKSMTVDTEGEIQIRSNTGLIPQPAEIQKRLAAFPEVRATTQMADGITVLEYGNRMAYPAIQGIHPDQVEGVIPLRKYIRIGSLDALDDDTVIISSGLAVSLGVYVGERVCLYSPQTLQKLKSDEYVMPVELRVVGIFEFGHQQLDGSVALVTLRRLQDLNGIGRAVNGINVKLTDGADIGLVAAKINADLKYTQGAWARTWLEANEAFLTALSFEKMMVTLITAFVTLVAIFLITSLLLVAIIRKTREIGLLAALGATSFHTGLCFCFQGALIGVAGTVLGIGLGLLTLENVNAILQFLLKLQGSWDSMVSIYQFNEVPAHVSVSELFWISTYAIAMSTVAGFIAAWRAARLKPVEALRSE